MTAPLMEASGVCAGYGKRQIVDSVSFALGAGERVSIIGPNGCGKTTLLKAICKLIPLMDGDIRLQGKSVTKMDRRRLANCVSMMPQISEQWFDFTVLDTVLMGRYSRRHGALATGSGEDLHVAEECLRTVGLIEQINDSITWLSGGQRQRLMLARAFAQEPSIIVLDEPTNHLDIKYQAELFEHLARWASQPGRAVIQVMHDLNLTRMYSDRVLLMSEGRVIASGIPAEVMDAAALDDAYGYSIRQFMQKSLGLWRND
ncbi:MAG: ABC transporter ATP-binding protein [Oscillospiraceae bacterium]|jgi:iron complex transport system ATP-binding protein|nr:ABC transporter ATP-binding protein [Oscillospiraceae bacterium]